MVSIIRYSDDKAVLWNEFNKKSKNFLFMFDRNYMDYHRERIKDHSLFFYDDDELIALLPMSEHGDTLISHGGLTYGGFITGKKMKQYKMIECFGKLMEYAKKKRIKSIIYKCIPHIYHNQPAEEDRYALFNVGAKLELLDVSTYINLIKPLKMAKGRTAQISRAKREGVIVRELCSINDFNGFIELENKVLLKRHGVHAVHTGDELKMLKDRFPDNIHLFVAYKEDKMIAGTIIYEYDEVVHTQYMAANDEARVIGALDLVISKVIDKYKNIKQWLDFGISTEHENLLFNEGLCAQKEGFGGRTGVYETWKVML